MSPTLEPLKPLAPVTPGRAASGAPTWVAILGADPGEVPPVRTALWRLAVDAGFADRADDVALVADELLANAQEHGKPPVGVRAWCDGRLLIEVSDEGDGFDGPGIWRAHPPALESHRGRGLWIARQLTDGVRVSGGRSGGGIGGAGGARVRIELCPEPHIGA